MSTPRVVPATPETGENWYQDDPALTALLATYVPPSIMDAARLRLHALGQDAPVRLDRLARLADRHRPILHRRSPEGERVDDVEFHPAYHELQEAARAHRVFTLPWHPFEGLDRGPRVVGFALGYLYAQAECGYYCPACMTDGAAFVLDRHAPGSVAEHFVPRLVQKDAEGAFEGAMYLTEKGGGSDVGAGTGTVARQAEDGSWRLTGEKWFASNCVADAALALARMTDAPGSEAIGLFVIPRHLEDGTRNPGLRIERLKEKLGVTSMPTGEVLLEDAHAFLVTPAPDGLRTMLEMVNLSRLYNAVASVATARRALREGQRVARHRTAFGKPLSEQPLFRLTLTKLTVDVEGALAFVLDTADAFDRFAAGDEGAKRAVRVLTPCAKALTGKLAVSAASEGCEMLGGVGYIEDYVTPRLLRDAQVLPIWEGTTNVQALEFLRVMAQPATRDAFATHVSVRLAEAGTRDDVKVVCAAVADALKDLGAEAARLADAPRERVEAAGIRLMTRAYHLHAAGLLARGAARTEGAAGDRLARIARLYAARHLTNDREEAERAVEAVAVDAGEGAILNA